MWKILEQAYDMRVSLKKKKQINEKKRKKKEKNVQPMKLFHKKLQPFTEMQKKKYCVLLERGGEEKEGGRRKGRRKGRRAKPA